uniref:Putative secreted protein n=1 Tax=Anopheles marajoara TaxID=58244 RepID=A0A2M4BKF7_9DIPT
MKMHRGTLLVVCLMVLLKCSTAEPRPDFGLDASVTGKSVVSNQSSVIASASSAINGTTANITLVSEHQLLRDVLAIVVKVADRFNTLGGAVSSTITRLAHDKSGNVTAAFGPALGAIAAVSNYTTNTLPGIVAELQPLIVKGLNDKFTDSFQHIGKALVLINGTLTTLLDKAQNAILQAGSAIVPAAIVADNLRPSLVLALGKQLLQLKGSIPVLQHTIDSSIENLLVADSFLPVLKGDIDHSIGSASELLDPLDEPLGAINLTISGRVLGKMGADLTNLSAEVLLLTNLTTVPSGTNLTSAVQQYNSSLNAFRLKTPSVPTLLEGVRTAVKAAFDTLDPLVNTKNGSLVTTLIRTLVANDRYSRYCFHKYKGFFSWMVAQYADESTFCIVEEVKRLQKYQRTLELILDTLVYDYEDVLAELTICNGIASSTNREACVALLNTYYKPLAEAFGGKLALLYRSIDKELRASGYRMTVCIRVKLFEFDFAQDLIDFEAAINACSVDGPTAFTDYYLLDETIPQ